MMLQPRHFLLAACASTLPFLLPTAEAQTLAFAGSGSTSLLLELGTGAALPSGPVGATCVWSANNNSTTGLRAVDSRVNPARSEAGQSFIAWTPAGGSCSAPGTGSQVYVYVATDSTVGDRCYFAAPKCTVTAQSGNPVGSAPAGLILGAASEVALPASIFNVVNNQAVTAAGTDIRPEDAKFATLRALTPCGQLVQGAPVQNQYLGLGYQTGTPGVGTQIKSYYSTAAFNVLDFNLQGIDPITGAPAQGSFSTIPIGAAPVVVFVNPGPGFSNAAITNLTHYDLSAFLSGAEARTQDAISGQYQNYGLGNAVTVLEREPLSGTYNALEYAVANTISFKSSQDVGQNQVPTAINCNGAAVGSNPMHIQNSVIGNGSYRNRVIGTAEMVRTVFTTPDSLGYAFWSVPNFKNATAQNAKYLTIDGIDPIQTVYTNGVLPTPVSGTLAQVTLANTANGNYPIWSTLRIVTSNPAPAGVTALVNATQQQVSFGGNTPNPDFVPFSALTVVHSHFQPTGVNFPSQGGVNNASNGDAPGCNLPEAGGDVAGGIFKKQTDGDFCSDFGLETGFANFRQ